MKILVVDDDAVSRMVAQEAVRSLGHECMIAPDGESGWEIYHGARPDVVISDWLMPGIDGIELCRRIRADQDSIYATFILVTGLDDKQHALEGMLAGADDYLTKPLNIGELRMRLVAASRLNNLHRRLADHQNFLEQLNLELRRTARVDSLTGVGNRLLLREDLGKMNARIARYGERGSIGLIDLDRFKAFNDTYGHLQGDRALQAVAETVSTQVRAEDGTYRFGGEEFVLLLANTGVGDAVATLDRIRREVQELALPHRLNPPWGVVTVSAGVAAARQAPADLPEQMLQSADAALYEAKQSGRNQVQAAPEHPRAGGPAEPGLRSA